MSCRSSRCGRTQPCSYVHRLFKSTDRVDAHSTSAHQASRYARSRTAGRRYAGDLHRLQLPRPPSMRMPPGGYSGHDAQAMSRGDRTKSSFRRGWQCSYERSPVSLAQEGVVSLLIDYDRRPWCARCRMVSDAPTGRAGQDYEHLWHSSSSRRIAEQMSNCRFMFGHRISAKVWSSLAQESPWATRSATRHCAPDRGSQGSPCGGRRNAPPTPRGAIPVIASFAMTAMYRGTVGFRAKRALPEREICRSSRECTGDSNGKTQVFMLRP